jgi:hypothetical protein
MDSVDTTNELGRLASRIIPHILNLYSSTRDLHLVLHGVLGILSLIGHETFSSCFEDMGAEKLHKTLSILLLFFSVVVYRRVDDLEHLFGECGWP